MQVKVLPGVLSKKNGTGQYGEWESVNFQASIDGATVKAGVFGKPGVHSIVAACQETGQDLPVKEATFDDNYKQYKLKLETKNFQKAAAPVAAQPGPTHGTFVPNAAAVPAGKMSLEDYLDTTAYVFGRFLTSIEGSVQVNTKEISDPALVGPILDSAAKLTAQFWINVEKNVVDASMNNEEKE